jgi:hypothetical protein
MRGRLSLRFAAALMSGLVTAALGVTLRAAGGAAVRGGPRAGGTVSGWTCRAG